MKHWLVFVNFLKLKHNIGLYETFIGYKIRQMQRSVDFFAPSSLTPLPGGDQALNLWGVVRIGGTKSSPPLFLGLVSTVDAPHIIGMPF